MTSLLHSLNIGTLATWLSVAGFGTVAIIVPNRPIPSAPRPELTETQWVPEDFTLGDTSPPQSSEAPAESAPASAEPLPAPPEMPAVAEIEPLPTVPMLPTPTENPTPDARIRPQQPSRKSSAFATSGPPSRQAASPAGKPSGTSGMANASRIAAGRMPSPVYPPEARRKGQTGTVVVQFTVDSSGRVTFAHAVSPSPWPLLNREAIRTVMLWRFPPGNFITFERPIVFQLR